MSVLELKNLEVSFRSQRRELKAVRGINFHVNEGEIVGIVGESGSGKSVCMKAVMGILPENAKVKADSILLHGKNILALPDDELRKIRGKEMTMVFQDPMTALNPLVTIGRHLEEVIIRHQKVSKSLAQEKSLELLKEVGISSPQTRLKQYPHELSGGMRQRVLIAMALACEPKLLIADEPTTALDVTIQAQILDLLKKLNQERGMSIALITHDMGVIASLCDRVYVMYGGKIMETALVEDLFYQAKHPYSKALLAAIPDLHLEEGERLSSIPGTPPSLARLPQGCPFEERCQQVFDKCKTVMPEEFSLSPEHSVSCHLYTEKPDGQEGGKDE